MWSIIEWEDLICGFCEVSDDMSSLDYYANRSEYILLQTGKKRLF